MIFIIPLVIASVFSISVSLYPMTFQTAIQAVIDAINGKEAIAYEDWIMRELVVNTYILVPSQVSLWVRHWQYAVP